MPHFLKSAPTRSFVDTSQDQVQAAVRTVIADIRARGGTAVRDYAESSTTGVQESFRLSAEQISEITDTLPQQVLDDITFVQQQVRHTRRSATPPPVVTWAGSADGRWIDAALGQTAALADS